MSESFKNRNDSLHSINYNNDSMSFDLIKPAQFARRVTLSDQAKERLQKIPYEDCINCFRTFATESSPLKKLQVLEECSALVEQSILDFWKGLEISNEKICLTIDEYLSIFMYIIVRSRLKDIQAHLMIIEQFLNEFTLFSSKGGQVFMTVQSATQFLKEMSEQRL